VWAEPLTREDVPAPLAPWIDWVLRGAEDAACPFLHGNAERRQCVWPSRLKLTLDDSGGRFRQEWRVYIDASVPLPGDARTWPEDVRIGEAAGVVVPRQGLPTVRLRRGRHVLTGSFRWETLPEFLSIPAETGLVSLDVRRKPIDFPDRDLAGRLWLEKRAEEREGESRLDVVVHRRVVDDVPLELEASIELRVSGKNREVLLGRALPELFTPMSLQSPLPSRLESDGRLRVQVRPGTWRLRLLARRQGGSAGEITLPDRGAGGEGPWDDEEVWVFDARNHLRLVHVEGVPAIDPQQTALPPDWKHLPAYLIEPGSRMRLVEKRRGDEDPAPDQLAITRTWWLDFDGGGYTVHDEMQGTLSRSWRLETNPPTKLGRVAIDGQDQFISRLEGADRAGVEVRQGRVSVDADSRIEDVRGLVPAVGWNHDFQSVSAQLNLPPGWRLFHATGVDDVQTTWTTRWSLLDIFLVLVTTMIVVHLWGWAWGAVALLTLTLIYTELGAPRWSWLRLLGIQALLRVVPEGKLRRAARLARLGAIGLLAVVAIPFVVQQARFALYPALEYPQLAIAGDAARAAGVVQAVMEEEEFRDQAEAKDMLAPSEVPSKARSKLAQRQLKQYYAPDPSALVSTGPGLPHWGWRAVRLSWRGPVQRDQHVRLALIPPWGNFLLAWLRVALTALLVLCVLDLGRRLRLPFSGSGSTALAGIALIATLAPSSAPADIPSQPMLDELRARLLDPPECFPNCAASPRMRLEVTPEVLRARVEIDTASATAVPLPGGIKHWIPETVLLDGATASGLAHSPDGRLWIPVSAGKHQVQLEGRLPARETVQIPLPLKPHRVVAKVSGWTLAGLRNGGEPENSLQLTRVRGPDDGPRSTLEPQDLPPFVRIARTARLGLSWQVDTEVVRMTPPGRALFLEVPLLPGESVTSEVVQVEDGKALVSMAPNMMVLQWKSVLDHASGLVLTAPDDVPWTEVWRLDVAPVWHVDVSGIPVVHTPAPRALRIREWRPWPGEKVELRVKRPQSVEGRVLTIDRVGLRARPGLRASEFALTLSLRASRGVQHTLVLPEGAELQSVKIDGALQPVRAVDDRVVLPIHPGKHTAELVWRSSDAISTRYETPAVDPGGPSVNAEIEVEVPADRWVLFLGGPRLGPAVLFWSLLLVALLLAWGLGRVRLTPLRWGTWFLLFVGLTQVPVWLSVIVVGWLHALAWRRDNANAASNAAFDGLQVLLAGWTGVALLTLVWAIQQGLLGLPEMQIAGNGSSGPLLRWYQDRSAELIPTAWMISVPLGLYRIAMLAWALWLARALVAWLRWAWQCFSQDGIWRPLRPPRVERATGP
jgi:hypothetical protein